MRHEGRKNKTAMMILKMGMTSTKKLIPPSNDQMLIDGESFIQLNTAL